MDEQPLRPSEFAAKILLPMMFGPHPAGYHTDVDESGSDAVDYSK